jgi:hypothetical protein
MSHMETSTITVPSELAAAFNSASPEEQEKALFKMGLALSSVRKQPMTTSEFLERMNALGRKAQERGLTPDILEDLLNEPGTPRP